MTKLLDVLEVRRSTAGRAFVAMLPYIRAADRLDAGAKDAVADWIAARGLAGVVEPSDFDAVAVTNAEVATAAFGGNASLARRGIAKLVSGGIVEKVREGRKGRSSVYIIDPDEVFHRVFHNSGEIGGLESTLIENRGTGKGGKGYREPRIGVPGDSLTCGSETHPEYIQNIYPEGAERRGDGGAAPPAARACPECGAEGLPITATLYECPECRKAFGAI